MVVCICHRVSDRDIARLAAQGCDSFEALQMASRVGTGCGRCQPCAQEVFAAHGCGAPHGCGDGPPAVSVQAA